MSILWFAILAYIVIINLVAFFLFKFDKKSAKKGASRVPEKRLINSAFLGGALGAWIAMHKYKHKTQKVRFQILIPLAFFIWFFPVASFLEVGLCSHGRILVTPLMIRRAVEANDQGNDYIRHYQWVDYDQMSPNLVRAVIASEDNLFATHNGFSKRGIKQAIREKREKGTVKHGGSTISQQTAKNVFTFCTRTWFRKGREVWFTVMIETFWTKQRIMEVYLNVIEMGDGIYGAEAASRQYFRHGADRLSTAESALIAACLPNPRVYSATRPGPYIQRRQQQIMALMPKMGKIDLNN